jgi:8-oxo-dGTP pyrophosphatase MutT (NUDIX family)
MHIVHHLVAAILVEGDRVLLGLRSPDQTLFPGVWDVFGGHIEPNEGVEQALLRELQEELEIVPLQWVELETLSESVLEHDETPAYDVICHFYHVTAWSGTPINRQPEEHSIIQWFSYGEAVELDLAHPSYPRLFSQCLGSMADNDRSAAADS